MKLNAAAFQAAYTATGVVREVEKFISSETERAALVGQPRPRSYDEKGRALVDLEIIRVVERFGKPATEVVAVRLPESTETKALQPGLVQFVGLSVDVYPKDGRLIERWSADGIASAGTTRRAGGEA